MRAAKQETREAVGPRCFARMEGMHVVGRTGDFLHFRTWAQKPRLGGRLGAALVDTAEGKLSGGISSLERRDNVCMMYCHAMAYLLDVQ